MALNLNSFFSDFRRCKKAKKIKGCEYFCTQNYLRVQPQVIKEKKKEEINTKKRNKKSCI